MGKFRYIKDLIKLCAAKCISPILKTFNKKFRDIWLIGERKSEAKDNGYHLFKYIRENHPDDEVYYVIDKNSNDLEKIKDLGNIIYHDSFKHYLYYAMSNKLICAHLGSCVPDSPVCWKFADRDMRNKKKVFIQHGITKELIPSLMYENTKADLFICGAKPEYDFVKANFGYPENSVKYTGFARFDALHDRNEKNQILVMPTWRQWIPSNTWSNRESDCNKIFLESDYYNQFNQLLNNQKLINLLEKNNMKLIFYLHHEMQGYIDLFNVNSDKIVIAREEKYDVQQLLKESKILITDYSSIAFDFGYMRKPIIYYQFDEDKYYKNHYQKGYYNYEADGFGPKVIKSTSLIDELSNILDNGIDTIFKSRYDKFFPLYDQENCKRHYEYISLCNK